MEAPLAPGEMETFFQTRTLYESTTNRATVTGTDDGSGGLCMPAQDEVPVTVVLPPTGSFSCWNAKPIDELSMEWGGAQDICVQAWDGEIGASTLLTTKDGIAPGDIFEVPGMGGSPYVQEWQIFAAGDCGGTPLGQSEFKISCHDGAMNGVEDCGKNQGNGKWDDPALINDWLLEGMAGDEVLDCTPVVIGNGGGGGGFCGLGAELAFLLPPIVWLRNRRRRQRA